MNTQKPSLDEIMRKMPEDWRKRWCEPGKLGCACLGCANGSGGLIRNGYTKQDWETWRAAHSAEDDR